MFSQRVQRRPPTTTTAPTAAVAAAVAAPERPPWRAVSLAAGPTKADKQAMLRAKMLDATRSAGHLHGLTPRWHAALVLMPTVSHRVRRRALLLQKIANVAVQTDSWPEGHVPRTVMQRDAACGARPPTPPPATSDANVGTDGSTLAVLAPTKGGCTELR